MNKIFGFLLIAAMLSTTGAQAADRHDFMNHIYDYIENLDVFDLNQDGLLENLPAWVFVEWSHANEPKLVNEGVNYPSNMTYSEGLTKR